VAEVKRGFLGEVAFELSFEEVSTGLPLGDLDPPGIWDGVRGTVFWRHSSDCKIINVAGIHLKEQLVL
jgi:hypothetical protein